MITKFCVSDVMGSTVSNCICATTVLPRTANGRQLEQKAKFSLILSVSKEQFSWKNLGKVGWPCAFEPFQNFLTY